jgi:murein DD-endopeptidase MepM/ murein hydrolase activator NlpD
VKIKHAGNMESIYGGLQEIDVEVDHPVLIEQVIGKTGAQFYFELRCKDDPVNPQSIFK